MGNFSRINSCRAIWGSEKGQTSTIWRVRVFDIEWTSKLSQWRSILINLFISSSAIFLFQVVAVGARALSSAESFAKEFNIPKAYGSYKELAQDPDLGLSLQMY